MAKRTDAELVDIKQRELTACHNVMADIVALADTECWDAIKERLPGLAELARDLLRPGSERKLHRNL